MRKPTLQKIYPVSETQQGILFHSLADNNSGSYITQTILKLQENIDCRLLLKSWQKVIDRHETLRSGFEYNKANIIQQKVYKHIDLHVNFLNLSDQKKIQKNRKINKILKEDKKAQFNLAIPPLLRLTLLKTSKDDYTLIMSHHHILMSGTSIVLVYKEAFSIYQAYLQEKKTKLPKPQDYTNYLNYLNKFDLTKAKKYWCGLLRDIDITPLPLEPPSLIRKNSIKQYRFRLPQNHLANILKVTEKYKLSINTFIESAWGLLLINYLNLDDVVFGAVRALPQDITQNMVGYFINTLPIRAKINSRMTTLEYLRDIRKQQVKLRNYLQTPLLRTQQWCAPLKKRTLFETIVDYKPKSLNYELKSLSESWERREYQHNMETNYPLTLEIAGEPTGLAGTITYDVSIYKKDTIILLASHYINILGNLPLAIQQIVSRLDLLSKKELKQILIDWNNSSSYYRPHKSVQQLFEEQVKKIPHKIAVTCENQSLTYQELNQKTNQLAHYLQKQYIITPETLVPICVQRNLQMIIGLLGILKAGAAYVPIDPAYPADRIEHILRDTNASILLTDKKLLTILHQQVKPLNIRVINIDDNLIFEKNKKPRITAKNNNLAYVMYTSGSTGYPKGVAIEHKSLINLIITLKKKINFKPNANMLAITQFTFDISTLEIFLPLVTGAHLTLISENERLNPSKIMQLITSKRIFMQATPTMWQMLIDSGWCNSKYITILCGGEPLSKNLTDQLLKNSKGLYNLYGPTETTIWSTSYYVTSKSNRTNITPIGKPIANTKVYVLNKYRMPVPVGATGELYIGGAGVARGYLNQPELTREKFIANPFSTQSNDKLYKTGDMVRWLPDGNLEFIGRIDNQVKIHGFRIELGEIECAILKHNQIKQCHIRVINNGAQFLVAYLVTKNNVDISNSELIGFVGKLLPAYMVPTNFVRLDRMPVNTNGKIDIKALPDFSRDLVLARNTFTKPGNQLEEGIACVWKKLLNLKAISTTSNIFEAGANSLIIAQARNMINKTVNTSLRIVDLFTYPTIKSLAEFIDNDSKITVNITQKSTDIALQKRSFRERKKIQYA